jgi:hypothetical protein
MTFRRSFSVPVVTSVFILLAGCAGKDQQATSSTGSTGSATDSSAGSVGSVADTSAGASRAASKDPGKLPPNHMGKIPVLEYHVIGGTANALYTRTIESFKADLEDVYNRGYRPITVAQMLDKDFSDVPEGRSPVVFVFDDASPEQFSYIEQNGRLTIDPNSGIGIWLDFAKTHPGWKNRATFCMLNGAEAGHNFFGDKPQFNGQKKEWRFQKVKWLADQGFELCDHTLWHMKLSKYSDDKVQEQIARNLMGIDSAVPGYKVRTMALPYGLWPRNRELAWQGSWTDPKTGKNHPYRFDAVLEVSGGPATSPYDPAFNPRSIKRIQAVKDNIRQELDRLDKTKTRFVK